jgi:hypothetical protein
VRRHTYTHTHTRTHTKRKTSPSNKGRKTSSALCCGQSVSGNVQGREQISHLTSLLRPPGYRKLGSRNFTFLCTGFSVSILVIFCRMPVRCEEIFLRSVRRLIVAACVVHSSPILVTLMKKALGSSETSVLQEPHGVTSQKTPFLSEIVQHADEACQNLSRYKDLLRYPDDA